MSKVIITTDSTCDLSDEIINQFNIKVLPFIVTVKDKTFLDRIDITTEQLYELVEQTKVLPKTAAPSSQVFYEFFKQYVDEGYDIVHVSISSKLSSAIQQAYLAAKEFPEGKVYIVDSLNLSSGVGLVAMKAARFVEMGLPAKEVAERAQEIAPKVETAFVIDTMDYLHKGGRCSAIQNFVGTLLKIKPIIHVVDGGMIVGSKPRGKAKAYEILLNKIFKDKERLDTEFVMVTHSLNFEAAEYIKERLNSNLNIENLYETTAGTVISSHCGKGTIGILYITK